MRSILFLCVIVSFVLGVDVHWEKDYSKALQASKAANKPVLMLVDRPHCPYCELLKEDIRETKAVSEFINEKFIPLLVTQDDGSYPSDKFIVYGTPTTFFVNANGEPYVNPIIGYVETEEYLKYLGMGLEYF